MRSDVTGAEAVKRKADAFAADVGPMVADMRQRGIRVRGIAAELTSQGIRTLRRGWSADTVRNLLQRAAKRPRRDAASRASRGER